jgi:hypothetical protein
MSLTMLANFDDFWRLYEILVIQSAFTRLLTSWRLLPKERAIAAKPNTVHPPQSEE